MIPRIVQIVSTQPRPGGRRRCVFWIVTFAVRLDLPEERAWNAELVFN
jgi:hypothetical protein